MRVDINSRNTIKYLAVCAAVLMIASTAFGSAVTDGYPGYPGAWDGLTTNTIVRIDLDEPVAMIGDQPDVIYTVKQAAFSGYDMVLSSVSCDVGVSDDGLTVFLYPQSLLTTNSLYAYKIDSINFAGGGSALGYTQCYNTGTNPVPALRTVVNESEMCSDTNGLYGDSLDFANFCGKCHTDYDGVYNDCIITP